MKSISHPLCISYIFIALAFLACNKNDDDNQNHFNITHVKLVLRYFDTNFELQTQEINGEVGNSDNTAFNEALKLKPNTDYQISLEFYDKTNAANVTEIPLDGERATHLICFSVRGVMAQPTIIDIDPNGQPIGEQSEFTTGNEIGDGSLKISLLHKPEKTAIMPCTTGSIDFEIQFPVLID